MGDTKQLRKHFNTPTHPWEDNRIDSETQLMQRYGLKNKEEIWRMNSLLKGFKDQVKKLNATSGPQADREERQLMRRLRKLKIITEDDSMDDVLALGVESILDRRLQTRVYKEGLARTPKQARQFVVHEHITVNGDTVDVPSYLVERGESIGFAQDSPFQDEMHPERVEEDHATDHVEEDVEEVDEIASTEERTAGPTTTLQFHPDVVEQILDGKTKTYELDEADVNEGDTVAFENEQTGDVFGTATIKDIEALSIGDIDLQDEAHGATYEEVEDLIAVFETTYPDREIEPDTTAYIYTYDFTRDDEYEHEADSEETDERDTTTEETDSEETTDETEESDEESSSSEKEIPARSTVANKTKDEMKAWAMEEWGVELSTNDLKDEMIDQFFEEVQDGE